MSRNLAATGSDRPTPAGLRTRRDAGAYKRGNHADGQYLNAEPILVRLTHIASMYFLQK